MSTEQANPANEVELGGIPADFMPMSAPVQRLSVPKKPGFHRHWFLSDPGRIERAMRAGYRFVNSEEVQVNNRSLGGPPEETGNSDLGTRVSIAAGDAADENGKSSRLYLMECPQHLFDYAQQLLDENNQHIVEAINAGVLGAKEKGENKQEQSRRYVKTGKPDLFRRKS